MRCFIIWWFSGRVSRTIGLCIPRLHAITLDIPSKLLDKVQAPACIMNFQIFRRHVKECLPIPGGIQRCRNES